MFALKRSSVQEVVEWNHSVVSSALHHTTQADGKLKPISTPLPHQQLDPTVNVMVTPSWFTDGLKSSVALT
eukprot:3775406-Amphidinium_carterae.1